MLCRHCEKVKSNRPRGLCWSCYYRPGVRDQYPSTSKYARRGVSDFNGRTAQAAQPTKQPGSAEKVEVLAERPTGAVAVASARRSPQRCRHGRRWLTEDRKRKRNCRPTTLPGGVRLCGVVLRLLWDLLGR